MQTAKLDQFTIEQRYHALLALGPDRREPGRAALYEWIGDEDPLIRNAAARALWERGERSAAAVLIRNLHRENRTFVTMDAVYHLRQMTGEDLGYDPNRGYREQTQAQNRWWTWWSRAGDFAPEAETPPADYARARAELAHRLREARELAAESPDLVEASSAALREAAAALGPSRWPTDQDRLTSAYELLVERYPDHPAAWANLAWSSLNASDFPRSEEAFRRALSLADEDPMLHNDFGILLEALGRVDEAEEHYRRATELDPGDDVAWANLGDTCAALGEHEQAIAAWSEAEALAPEKWYYHRLWRGRLGDGGSAPAPR